MATFLLILGEREGLRWVLANRRMAFPAHRRAEASAVKRGDTFLLYTTRGCFHNPTRDRGRVVGRARVTTPVRDLPEVIEIGGREFVSGCDLKLTDLLPRGEGPELSSFVADLETFPQAHAWSVRLRRSLLPLPDGDATVLTEALGPQQRTAAEVEAAATTYG